MGAVLFSAGRIEEAIARFRSTLELDPQYFFARRGLAVINVVLGNHAEAIAGLEAAGDRGSLGHAFGVAGRSADARRVLEALEQDARQRYVSPVQMALVHLGLGEHDEALACLEQAFRIAGRGSGGASGSTRGSRRSPPIRGSTRCWRE